MRVIVLALVFWFPCLGAAADTGSGPIPPCDSSVLADIPAAGSPPRVRVWQVEDLGGTWRPADCLDWENKDFSLLLEVAGRFHHQGDSEGLVERLAAVSRFEDILYWSVTRSSWRRFIGEAHALRGPDPDSRREDFALVEMMQGASLYFWQDDNSPVGAAVYRLIVRERRPDRLVVAIENASPVRFMLMPLLDPGEHQFFYVFERQTPTDWRYYSLMRTAGPANGLIGDFTSSYINRAVAIYRHLTGLPTNMEPPAAR